MIDRSETLGQSRGKWRVAHDWGESPNICSGTELLKGMFVSARRRFYLGDTMHSILNKVGFSGRTLMCPSLPTAR